MATLIEVVSEIMADHPSAEACRVAAEANQVCPIELKTVFGHDLMSKPGDTPTQQLKTWILRAASLLDQQDGSHIPLVAAITKSSEEFVMEVIAGI